MKVGLIATFVLLCWCAFAIEEKEMSSYFDDDDEISLPEFEQFKQRFGEDYGYNDTIDTIREKELKRFKGDAYFDYTGSGVYQESQVWNCAKLLADTAFGNTHSKNPSSINTETEVENIRKRILNYFNADPLEYSVIFTSGATGALHTVGEIFPWSKESQFYYLSENHNSVIGIREYATKFGGGFKNVDEQDLPKEDMYSIPVDEEMGKNGRNTTYSLFAFPAEDNFAGVKYPLRWIQQIQDGYFSNGHEWLVLLDAAAFVPTNKLDLSKYKPDFVVMSFYKLFGYPTGIGALLLRDRNVGVLRKLYWGGGTVSVSSEYSHFSVFHGRPCSKFEDGTINYLSIICLKYGLDVMESMGMDRISRHVSALTRVLYEKLSSIRYANGNPAVEIYGKHEQNDASVQGSIVAFNLLRFDGSYVGYYDVQLAAAKANIHLRTGCHCNPGACRKYLKQPMDVFERVEKEKRSCADTYDRYNGVPLGGVRASLGYLTTFNDVMALVDFVQEFIEECFVCYKSVSNKQSKKIKLQELLQ